MFKKIIIFVCIFSSFFLTKTVFAALSCSVSTSCSSPDVVVLRMSSTSNSHAELPSQSNYTQLVCCSGVTDLSNSCSDTFGVVLRLSGTTNAHVEENTESTAAYDGNNTCLSVPSGGTVTVGYQNTSCSGFDTTVASISQTPTNAHIGDGDEYTRKICATATGASTPSAGGGSGGRFLSVAEIQEILRTADFNRDGRVDILDLSILLYFIDNQHLDIDPYDLVNDGVLDFLDISVLFYYWDLLT